MKTLFTAVLALSSLSALAHAQSQNGQSPEELRPLRPDLQPLTQSWRAEHGASWRVREDRLTGSAELIFGGSAQGIAEPTTDAQWIEQAQYFLELARPMHLTPNEQLAPEVPQFLPLGLANSTDKMSVHFRQEVDGVPVENGYIGVLMNMQGDLLSVHNTTLPGLAELDTTPGLTLEDGRRAALRAFRSQHGNPTQIRATELQVVRLESEVVTPRLAWVTEVLRKMNSEEPVGESIVIDAENGQVLRRASIIHNFDVGGTVFSEATPGSGPDTASNPEVQIPMPYLRVVSSAGTTFTDENGNFNFPGVNGPLQIDVEYRGQFNRVFNNAGAEYSETFTGQTGTNNTFVMNPSTPALVTAQANAYLHINTVRDFIRNTTPSDSTADFLVTSNANLAQNCNAFFDGGSVNYFTEGGGCVNTAYSTVVAHEFGHWLNVLYSTGNGSDGMGEGNADVFAMYTFDGPVVGLGFCGNGCNIRTGLNTRPYCGDGNGGCHGGVHANGEVWMGTAWKIRRNLKNSNGAAAGGMIADALFMGWMNGFNQTQIDSVIELQWLALDDDDGNIDNGTPNYGDIDSGFREQSFPGFDLASVIFANVTELDDQNSGGPYTVDADITAQFAAGIASADLFYRTIGGTFASVPMTQGAGNTFSADIPAQVVPNAVQYYISATDTDGADGEFPTGGEDSPLFFGIGTPVDVAAFDFEANNNEGWTAGAPSDTATTGVWVRGDPRPTDAQPGDDISNPGVNCWFTGQGPVGGGLGDNDVDGGATTLLSPIFDATQAGAMSVSYWRWYSNNQGASPSSDIFRISVSNDGGNTWTQAEQVGPTGEQAGGGWIFSQFFIEEVVTPTANMRLRFVAEDAGAGSIVEAAIDEVTIRGFEGSGIGQNYCVSVANSTLSSAVISADGSDSIAANDLVLSAGPVPNQPGIFFYGPDQILAPFGDGFRCVGGVVGRLAPTTGSGNVMTTAVDYSAPPSGSTQITVGSTWNFQAWFRDPSAGLTGFNLSDALEITFQP